MKFSRALLALPALSSVTFAAPLTNGELHAPNQSPNPNEEVKAHLDKRALTCQSVARAIWVSHGALLAAYVLIQSMSVAISRRWDLTLFFELLNIVMSSLPRSRIMSKESVKDMITNNVLCGLQKSEKLSI